MMEMMDYVMRLNYTNLHLTMEHENELMDFVDYPMIDIYYKLAKDELMLERQVLHNQFL